MITTYQKAREIYFNDETLRGHALLHFNKIKFNFWFALDCMLSNSSRLHFFVSFWSKLFQIYMIVKKEWRMKSSAIIVKTFLYIWLKNYFIFIRYCRVKNIAMLYVEFYTVLKSLECNEYSFTISNLPMCIWGILFYILHVPSVVLLF